MFTLSRELRRTPLEALFADSNDRSTRRYLEDLGFSTEFRNRFLHPFLAGIFLEADLETPSRMARFVLKMFAEGSAVLPPGGIAQAAEWLQSELQATEFRLASSVAEAGPRGVTLETENRSRVMRFSSLE